MALVLAVVNPKGGVGKSMLATNLAVAFYDRGFSTAVIDCDEQGTTFRDLTRVEPAIVLRNPTELEAIAESVVELKADHELIIVDSPGKSGEAVSTLCLVADSILIPLQPSKRDLTALGKALTLIRTAQTARAGKPATKIVLNFTRKRDVAARLIRQQLSPLGVPIADTRIRRLDALRDCSVVVRHETPEQSDAAADLFRLVEELSFQHMLLPQTPRMAAHE